MLFPSWAEGETGKTLRKHSQRRGRLSRGPVYTENVAPSGAFRDLSASGLNGPHARDPQPDFTGRRRNCNDYGLWNVELFALWHPRTRVRVIPETRSGLHCVLRRIQCEVDVPVLHRVLYSVERDRDVFFPQPEETTRAQYKQTDLPVWHEQQVHDFAHLIVREVVDALLVPIRDRPALARHRARSKSRFSRFCCCGYRGLLCAFELDWRRWALRIGGKCLLRDRRNQHEAHDRRTHEYRFHCLAPLIARGANPPAWLKREVKHTRSQGQGVGSASEGATELQLITDAVEAYEIKRWLRGKVPGGKG